MGQTAEQKAAAEKEAAVKKAAADKAAADEKAAAEQEAAGELTNVKFLRSHPHYGYFPGQEGELPTAKAEKLMAGGFAEQA